MSPDAWLELVKTGGALGALILVIWLLAKRKFVLGYMYEQEREEKIMWRSRLSVAMISLIFPARARGVAGGLVGNGGMSP